MHVIVMRNHFTIDSNPMNAKHSQTCQHKYHLIEAIEMSEIMSKNVIAFYRLKNFGSSFSVFAGYKILFIEMTISPLFYLTIFRLCEW